MAGNTAEQNIPVETSCDAQVNFKSGEHEFFASSVMEELCSPDALAQFREDNRGAFHVFGETRENAVRRFDAPPAHWLKAADKHLGHFEGNANPGEFFVFQLAVLAGGDTLENLRLEYRALNCDNMAIPAVNFTCFNLGGNDFQGRPFTKALTVEPNRVQPLWIGVQIPSEAAGLFRGSVLLRCDGLPPVEVGVALKVGGEVLCDHGDGEERRLARLRWLNSAIGIDEKPCAPFTPLKIEGRAIRVLGRMIELAPSGLPRQISSFFENGNTSIGEKPKALLAAPFRLVLEEEDGAKEYNAVNMSFSKATESRAEWSSSALCGENAELSCAGAVECDGYMAYTVTIKAKRQMRIKDVRLELFHATDAAEYFMGLGWEGGKRPDTVFWKWNDSCSQDGYWLGAVDAGLKIQLRDSAYRQPLVNCYYNFGKLRLPDAWHNSGRGGIRLDEAGNCVKAAAFSGARTLEAGAELEFGFELWTTPFKPALPRQHWEERIYHLGYIPQDFDYQKMRDEKITVVAIHHAQECNPIINYPYSSYSFDKLKEFVEKTRAAGFKVCLYYTARELTIHIPEFWAFFSMGGEIVFPGPGAESRPVTNRKGPHPWLVEHLRENFLPAWRQPLACGLLDLSVITTPHGRLENFYLEGLNYLLGECKLDGLYLDDCSLSRTGLQRMLKIFARHGVERPIIDFHAWNPFHASYGDSFGFSSVICRDFPSLPYFSRLWLGEGFDYATTNPNYWLTEISGLPFGLMSEMLGGTSNPWRGMIYGMTDRAGGGKDPRPLWRFLSGFGVGTVEMLGYWDDRNPVKTSSSWSLATTYVSGGKTLVALASWEASPRKIKLEIDYGKLAASGRFSTISAPPIEGLQRPFEADIGAELTLEPGQGMLLLLQ